MKLPKGFIDKMCSQLIPYTPTYMQYPGCKWNIDPRGFMFEVEDLSRLDFPRSLILAVRLIPEEKV